MEERRNVDKSLMGEPCVQKVYKRGRWRKGHMMILAASQ